MDIILTAYLVFHGALSLCVLSMVFSLHKQSGKNDAIAKTLEKKCPIFGPNVCPLKGLPNE
jgi:hypothetical protein